MLTKDLWLYDGRHKPIDQLGMDPGWVLFCRRQLGARCHVHVLHEMLLQLVLSIELYHGNQDRRGIVKQWLCCFVVQGLSTYQPDGNPDQETIVRG